MEMNCCLCECQSKHMHSKCKGFCKINILRNPQFRKIDHSKFTA